MVLRRFLWHQKWGARSLPVPSPSQPPADRKHRLYYEARRTPRNLKVIPGEAPMSARRVSHDSPGHPASAGLMERGILSPAAPALAGWSGAEGGRGFQETALGGCEEKWKLGLYGGPNRRYIMYSCEQNSASCRESLRGSYTHGFFFFCFGGGKRFARSSSSRAVKKVPPGGPKWRSWISASRTCKG